MIHNDNRELIIINYLKFMQKAPRNETKRERFKRLASLRTNKILNYLKVLGNCSNRQIYEYTKEDINKIFNEIERKVKEIKSRFHFPKEKEFKL